MGPTEVLTIAVESLLANRGRTALSALGIIIGVASVITMISVGASAERRIGADIAGLGSNLIIVAPSNKLSRPARDYGTLLTPDLAEDICTSSRSIRASAPVVEIHATLYGPASQSSATVAGVTPDYGRIMAPRIALGRGISDSDVARSSCSMVLGWAIASRLFGDSDPVGQTIRVSHGERLTHFIVVGVTEKKASVFVSNSAEQAFIPVTSMLHRLLHRRHVGMLLFQAESGSHIAEAMAHIERRLLLASGSPDAFTVTSQEGLLDAMRQATATMTLLLGATAGISLVVGGIGIMNTLLASVAERTREVGLRKSLGARNRDIMLQFLAESVALSIMGGAPGLLVGWLAGAAIADAAGWPHGFSASSVVAALGVSSTVGVAFGMYPALKASRMNPIVALRQG
ncbi:MAG: ABC transporter permease [Clostridia bacterium]|nr:ABC transporter permease [Clostridia bacterium]